MSRYANLDIFSSFLSLKETSSPLEEASKIIKQLESVEGPRGIKALHKTLRDQKMALEHIQEQIAEIEMKELSYGSYRSECIQSAKDDAVRIGYDFEKAIKMINADTAYTAGSAVALAKDFETRELLHERSKWHSEQRGK
ncbi:hypothetical protein NLK61_04155 [Pseudomonas fuscovaginae UPB0736]|uniref:hypothetical protein n=1 Tax=Pseudomonas asplenii TaxID=53407 RepID=UPI000289D376|nr:hypothetical protein [Pseudomonas fuscovaginae]UUQ65852.1 hypothetical protein NLK61_04155 [Pseudomonas fuscovaginae UPB0736]